MRRASGAEKAVCDENEVNIREELDNPIKPSKSISANKESVIMLLNAKIKYAPAARQTH